MPVSHAKVSEGSPGEGRPGTLQRPALRLSRYVDRSATLLDLCRGRRVLHLGCVGFTDCSLPEKVALARQSLHKKVSEVADCVGLDIDQETIEQLKGAGVFQNIMVGNAERLEQMGGQLKPFDVVLAGDIIEHLSNPGAMLEGAKAHLKPGGCLLVSTPNSMGLPAYLRYVTGRFQEGRQHVLCFNGVTLAQLLERHGYEITQAFSCYQGSAGQPAGLAFRLGRAFFERFPKLGGTLLFVARVPSPSNQAS